MNRIFQLNLFIVLLHIPSSLLSMNIFNTAYKKYVEWRLGAEIINTAKKCQDRCSPEEIVDTTYQPPAYIRWLSTLPLLGQTESETEYIQHLYTYLADYVDKAFYAK